MVGKNRRDFLERFFPGEDILAKIIALSRTTNYSADQIFEFIQVRISSDNLPVTWGEIEGYISANGIRDIGRLGIENGKRNKRDHITGATRIRNGNQLKNK